MPSNLGEVGWDIRSVGMNWDICQLHQWVGERAPPPEGWRSSSRSAMQAPNSDQNSNSYQILTPVSIYLLGAYRVRNHQNCDAHIGQIEIIPCYQGGLSFLNPWTGLYGFDSEIQYLHYIILYWFPKSGRCSFHMAISREGQQGQFPPHFPHSPAIAHCLHWYKHIPNLDIIFIGIIYHW